MKQYLTAEKAFLLPVLHQAIPLRMYYDPFVEREFYDKIEFVTIDGMTTNIHVDGFMTCLKSDAEVSMTLKELAEIDRSGKIVEILIKT